MNSSALTVPEDRIAFEFQPTPGKPPLDWRDRVPAGFIIRRIDKDIAIRLDADLAANLGYSWFDQVWGGVDAFLSHAFGYVAEHSGEGGPPLACNCRQWGAPTGIAPIQVSTRVAFRNRGLATLVCAAFIEECLARGLTPEYSCDSGNSASAALAAKLGFVNRVA